MRRLSAALYFASLGQALWAQDSARVQPGALTLDDVISMSKEKLSEELIVTRVKRNNKPFELGSGEIVELHKLGVSDTVIKFLVDPSLPYSPPVAAPAPPAAAPVKLPEDLASLDVPPEPGAYWMKAEKQFVRLDMKPVMPAPQNGGMIAALSGSLKKSHKIGVVAGAKAPTRVDKGAVVFYLRLSPPQSIDDIVFFAFVPAEGRRTIDFGPKAGKAVYPVKTLGDFESKEASPALFRINVKVERAGEYGFFVLGSGDEKKGTLGKAYEFGVD